MKSILFIFAAIYSMYITALGSETKNNDYVLDGEKSMVEWSGASPKASHQRSFAVTSQGIEVVDGQVRSGIFVIPITSIKNYDLLKTNKPVLIKHLKSKDFFNKHCSRRLLLLSILFYR